MYRAASGLRALKLRAVDAQILKAAVRSASTSVTQSTGGFLSWLTGRRSNQLPLDFPLPGVTIPPSLPDHIEPGKTKITTLPNGVKIASETSASPSAFVGLYVDCGSVYETPATLGVSQLLEKMAFTTTTNRSQLRAVREIEATGGKVEALASRELMSYTYAALKTYMPEMVELLIDSIRNPAFLDWEVKEQVMKLKTELGEVSSKPENLLLEALHSTGYSGALANPLIPSASSINRLGVDILEEFVLENYTAPRIVLAASGVEHDELVSVAEPLLSDLPNVAIPEKPKSAYVGGEYRRQADSSSTHVALAFEIPGGWYKGKDVITLSVLKMLLGGGGSVSCGRPGKGLYSRLSIPGTGLYSRLNRVINKFEQIQSISAFKNVHKNTGIFGIHASTDAAFVPKVIDLATRELISIATPGEVNQVELDRVKASTKSAILMHMETKMVATEDIGLQVLAFGERKPIEHLLKAVDGVTVNDLTSLAEKIISSPLTMVSYGDVHDVPTYGSVSGKFRT